jgi:hypothetical protein
VDIGNTRRRSRHSPSLLQDVCASTVADAKYPCAYVCTGAQGQTVLPLCLTTDRFTPRLERGKESNQRLSTPLALSRSAAAVKLQSTLPPGRRRCVNRHQAPSPLLRGKILQSAWYRPIRDQDLPKIGLWLGRCWRAFDKGQTADSGDRRCQDSLSSGQGIVK